MAWDLVATRLPFPSGKNGSGHSCQGYHTRITQLAQTRKELVFRSWGKTGPRDREAGSWPKTQKSNTKIFLCDLALDIPGGDGEKTLGEVEKTFILWRKHYIIIPEVSSPPSLPQLLDNRCGQK